jgi:squalene-hopene/tetraprenyl-beta-curcumene cyclase
VSTTERPLEAGRPSLFGTAPRQDRAVSRRQARDAAERAASHLLSLQHPEGYWKGELETNVTMDAEDLLLREFLGISTPRVTQATARWIRSKQRSDGTWASFYEGPGELSTTVEAYVALRLAGDSPTDPHLAKAAAFIQSEGGLEATRVFTRLWLALFGLWSWDELPSIPPELIALPLSVPFNIYDFACWARQTIVALAVVACYQPVRPLSFSIEELHATGTNRARRPLLHPGTPFELADGLLRHYGRVARGTSPFSQSREAALAACERWIIRRQEADGSWGGIQPPWVYSIIALHLRGYPLDHPVLAGALAGLESFVIEENGMRRLEACQSPVWDTAFAVIGLADAGIASDHPALLRAAEWLVGEEVRVKGDWAVRRPDLAPGGWSFEFENDNYPDIDDTAEVILALRRVRHRDSAWQERISRAIERGVTWVEGMASSDGGWAAFDADNTETLCRDLPFCDFGEVIDPPSADVTAHVLEMLGHEPGADPRRIRDGLAWLRASQEQDGSFFGRWGNNYIYGIGAALPALVATGTDTTDPAIRRAVAWLAARQNDDGGFGEDIRSYRQESWRGRGVSTASQTAWAVLGLLAAGESRSTVTERAISFLVTSQRHDGSWDEPWYTGTGFPGDFSINYHLYRLVFPLSALGRYLRDTREA